MSYTYADVRPDDAGRFALVDAALAPVGHEVTDAWSRDLFERIARREVSEDEAVAALCRRFQE